MTYSHKNFTGQYLTQAADLGGQTIIGSCFSHEKPDTVVFPDDMAGVTFIRCNLDNVVIPPGNTLVECQIRRFLAQDDGLDWEVDENNNPLNPLGE